MAFCSNCGCVIADSDKFCKQCGTPNGNQAYNASSYGYAAPPTSSYYGYSAMPTYNPLSKVSQKIKTSGTWWTVAMVLRYIFAAIALIICIVGFAEYASTPRYIYFYSYPYYNYVRDGYLSMGITGLIMFGISLTMAIISTKKASATRRLSNAIMTYPVGIVATYQKAHSVALLVVNILFGGAFGIVAAAYEMSVKNTVACLTPQLLEIERNAVENNRM